VGCAWQLAQLVELKVGPRPLATCSTCWKRVWPSWKKRSWFGEREESGWPAFTEPVRTPGSLAAPLEAPVCWDAFHFRVQVDGLLKKKSDGRWMESLRENQRPEFLLYLMNSLCQLLEEDPEDRTGIEYRVRLLRESSSARYRTNSFDRWLRSLGLKPLKIRRLIAGSEAPTPLKTDPIHSSNRTH
jgi:hypothetical protein